MDQENNYKNPFDQPGNTLIVKSPVKETDAQIKSRRAKDWAQEMSKPDAGWWTKLTHEVPLDIAEGVYFGDDPAEDRRNRLLEQFKRSQATGKPLDKPTEDAWTKLLTAGEY